MSDEFIMAPNSQYGGAAGNPGDRGCVACGHTVDPVPAGGPAKLFVGDWRGRYWCLGCAVDALGNIRRRNDSRDDSDVYRWRFDDPARPAKPDAKRVEAGDYVRAGGDTSCPSCGFAYYDHAVVVGYSWLRRACDGRLFKL